MPMSCTCECSGPASQPAGNDLPAEAPPVSGSHMPLHGRSLVLLAAAPLMEGAEL